MMHPYYRQQQHFFFSNEGATSSEYAIMASLIAGAVALAVTSLGTSVLALFESVRFW